MGQDNVDNFVKEFKLQQLEDSDNDGDDDDPDSKRHQKPFVDWWSFNLGIGCVIAVNALVIGLETEAKVKGSSDSSMWYILNVVFTLVFLVELCLRIYFHRLAFFTMPPDRRWNILDFFLIVIALLDTLVLEFIGNGGNARAVSIIRFVRLARLVRVVRLFKIFKELWLVASGLIHSMKTLFWVAIMLVLFIEICAVFTTRSIGHNDKDYDEYFLTSGGWDHETYFKTVAKSMLTLLQVATFDDWGDGIARHVVKRQPGMVVFFVLFIAVTSFGLLNIIIGVVVENVLATASRDTEKTTKQKERDQQQVFNQLHEIFDLADVDGSGTLDIEEVQAAISKPEIYTKLKMIDFPVSDPHQIFTLLDFDNSGDLTIQEFIAGCMRMKGPAKSKDVLAAQVAIDVMRKYCGQFESELEVFREKLHKLDITARSIVDHGEHVFLSTREFLVRHPSMKGIDKPHLASEALESAPWERREFAQPPPPHIFQNFDRSDDRNSGDMSEEWALAIPGAPQP